MTDQSKLAEAVGRVRDMIDYLNSRGARDDDIAALRTLLDALTQAGEVIEPFATIKSSSFYPKDGSKAEEYTVTLRGHFANPAEFTGADLATARAFSLTLKSAGLTHD